MKTTGRKSTNINDVRGPTAKAQATATLKALQEPGMKKYHAQSNKDAVDLTQGIFRPNKYATPESINNAQRIVKDIAKEGAARPGGWSEKPILGRK